MGRGTPPGAAHAPTPIVRRPPSLLQRDKTSGHPSPSEGPRPPCEANCQRPWPFGTFAPVNTLHELRAYADEKLFQQDYPAALHAYTALVRLDPTGLDARLRVADTLLAVGEVQHAAEVYTALARHAAHAGYPLRALVAAKVLEALEPQLAPLVASIAQLYGKGSERLGRGLRLSMMGDANELPEFDLDHVPALADLTPVAAALAADVSTVAIYPEQVPPIPLFSDLPHEAFARLLSEVNLLRVRPGQVVLQQGDPGLAFYVLARGEVEVVRQNPDQPELQLAKLADGAIFGEMALVSAQPRSATVRATTDADLLEIDAEALTAAASAVPTIAAALERFTRERLLGNLMATSPLFRPLDRKQRLDLVRRFSAHDVSAGTAIIEEGSPGRGLYLLLHGQADVSKRDGDEKVLLATLGPTDAFGEISLLGEEPTTATVRAATQCTVLFLSRELFQKLAEAVPEILDYVEELSDQRRMDTRLTLSSPDVFEIDLDDLVLI